MNLRRASEEEKHLFDSGAYIKRTTLVAEKDHLLATLQYTITSHTTALIDSYTIYKEGAFDDLIEELHYWNPFIKYIQLSDGVVYEEDSKHLVSNGFIEMHRSSPLIKVDINDIIPEQLSVDQSKVDDAMTWVSSAEDIVVSCVMIDDKLVCIDGYSRLIVGLRKGIDKVYVFLDDSDDFSLYRTCYNWCQTDSVFTLMDLNKRVVDSSVHKRLWIDRCQKYFEEVESERD